MVHVSLADVAALIPGDARIIAVAGAVAAGKSTLSRSLAGLLRESGRGIVAVVSTDGFLLPNSALERLGLIERKGFPESYDIDALRRFAAAVRNDASAIAVPEYSHSLFDVVAGTVIAAPAVAILEGVNALQPDVAALADAAIYLDASDDAVLGWYVDRFVSLTDEARRTGSGYYVRFASLDDTGVADMARAVWAAINGPNLDLHIRPTSANASIVVTKGADHSITGVRQVVGQPGKDG